MAAKKKTTKVAHKKTTPATKKTANKSSVSKVSTQKSAPKKAAPKKASIAKDTSKKVASKKVDSSKSTKSSKTSKATPSSSTSVIIDPNNPLGKKFTCYSCGTKFYDLNKPEKLCPKCGADQMAKPALRSRQAALRASDYDYDEDDNIRKPSEDDDDDEDAFIEEDTETGDTATADKPIVETGDDD
jgi:rubrerythrin